MHVRTTGEYYTVLTHVGSGAALRGETRRGRYTEPLAATTEAMRVVVSEGISCKVQRITTHDPVPNPMGWGPPRTETVTGEVDIPMPQTLANHQNLSRYHPVNGWAVPETIDVE